jgi:replicative DNA helicase
MKYSVYARRRFKEITTQHAAKERGEDPRIVIPTGLRELDKLGGTKRGILTIVGGATGQGKDIYAMNLVEGAAKLDYSVEYWSMEDPPERTVDRSLSKLTDINNADIYSLKLDKKQLSNIKLALTDIEDWGENIELHEGLKEPEEVLEELEASDADLRLVNYLQCFPGNDLERDIANFCWKANKIAQEQGCAVVAMSQVNTAKVEERGLRILERSLQRDSDKPNVRGFAPWGASDLAWCQAAGQRAKDLRFIWRPNYYLRQAGVAVKDDVMEITGTKNSFGSEGRVRVGFDGKTARLYDLAE